MDTALSIANYMLSKKVLTPKQVQKLLYYAYSMYLVKYNNEYDENNMNRLFEDRIEAWEHGPVIRNVYDRIKNIAYSYQTISYNKQVNLSSKRIENFIDKILMVFGRYSGYELEKMTHAERPWIEAMNIGRNQEISDRTIFEFYTSKYRVRDNI